MSKNFQDFEYLRGLYGDRNQIPSRGEFLKRYSNRNRSIRDILVTLIGDCSDISVIDIGAGNGSFLSKIKKRNPSVAVSAIDIIENPQIKQNYEITYRVYDGVHLPSDFGKFDVILMMHMLYHVVDVREFLKSAFNTYGKQGSRLFITTKSMHTMPQIETEFQSIVSELNIVDKEASGVRDEAHFCRENAGDIIKDSFQGLGYSIKQYDLDTQILVDNSDDLMNYILSTPRYGSKFQSVNYDRYIECWINRLSKYDLFIDTYKETICVVEF